MKTKHFFLVLCLIMGIGMFQVNAKDPNPKTIQGWFMSEYWSPVYCDGEMIDLLEGGTIRVHYVVHYKDGAYQWEVDQLKGEVTSQTGEVFRVREVDRYYFTDHWYVTWHYNLIGNWGTHYTGTLTYSYWTKEITVGNTVCH